MCIIDRSSVYYWRLVYNKWVWNVEISYVYVDTKEKIILPSKNVQNMLMKDFLTEYMCHKWPRTCSVWRNHNPVLFVFMTYQRVYVCNNCRTTVTAIGVNSGAPGGLLQKKNKLAQSFNFTFLYTDEVLFINKARLCDFLDRVHPNLISL